MKSRRKSRNDFIQKRSKFDETFYDLEFDRELIVQSIAKQYHILPSEQENLHYSDWYRLVAGLMDDTPLGRIVAVRAEDDKDRIKHFGAYEKRVRSEWRAFRDSQISAEFSRVEKKNVAEYFEQIFKNMLGGE